MTQAELETQIAAIDAQILVLVTKPTYKAGEYSVNWTQHLKELREMRKEYQAQLEAVPCEEITLWRDH